MKPEECEHGVPVKHTCYKCGEHGVSASFSNKLLCSMPRELTAENGAKGLLSGEFKEVITLSCPDCDCKGHYCTTCDNKGEVTVDANISCATIKEIYAMAFKDLGT